MSHLTLTDRVGVLLTKLGMSRRTEVAAYAGRLEERKHRHHHD